MTTVDAVTGAQAATATWHPDFQRALDTAQAELRAARKVLGNQGPGIIGPEEAIERAHRAEEQIAWLLVQWEDVPEPAIDALRGALTETRALLQDMHGQRQGNGIVPPGDIGGRIEHIITRLAEL